MCEVQKPADALRKKKKKTYFGGVGCYLFSFWNVAFQDVSTKSQTLQTRLRKFGKGTQASGGVTTIKGKMQNLSRKMGPLERILRPLHGYAPLVGNGKRKGAEG